MPMFLWNRSPCKQKMLTWNLAYIPTRDHLQRLAVCYAFLLRIEFGRVPSHSFSMNFCMERSVSVPMMLQTDVPSFEKDGPPRRKKRSRGAWWLMWVRNNQWMHTIHEASLDVSHYRGVVPTAWKTATMQGCLGIQIAVQSAPMIP